MATADGDAEHGADRGDRRVAAGLKGGEQEDGGLEALPQDGEKCHRDQRIGRAAGERGGRGSLEIALHVPGVAPHPHDHEGDHGDGEQPDDGLEALLLGLRQALLDDLEEDADADADRHGGTDPDPDLTQGIPATVAAEEGGDDADDQRRLEPLP